MNVLIADTETTSADTDTAEIIEAAWLHMPGTVVEFMAIKNPGKFEHYHQRFNPSTPIQFGAMATHNIIPEELEDCAKSELFELPPYVDYLIGHNIDFDARMMKVIDDPTIARICTLALSRWLFPGVDSHKQGAMIYYIGSLLNDYAWAKALTTGAHAALDDVKMCAILLRFLIGELRRRNYDVDTWEQLHAMSETARIPTVMGFGKHKGAAIADVPSDYVRWYRGTDDKDQYLLEAFKRAGK